MVRNLSLERSFTGSPWLFNSLIFGGTFDRFHAGHFLFLEVARSLASYTCVGLVTDEMLAGKEKKYGHIIHDYRSREEALLARARQMGFVIGTGAPDLEIVPIERDLGKGDTIAADAIIASEETYPVILQMNESRRESGLPPLKVIVLPEVVDKDGKRVSSTRLRELEVNEKK
ncbi:MAG: pantetheine-phosphate adenylyltransferase [Candidatus Odinarchaeota archaeon]